MIGLAAVSQQRHQLAIVIAQGALQLTGLGILDFEERGPVVIPAQAARRIALHKRSVAGAPAQTRAQVAGTRSNSYLDGCRRRR